MQVEGAGYVVEGTVRALKAGTYLTGMKVEQIVHSVYCSIEHSYTHTTHTLLAWPKVPMLRSNKYHYYTFLDEFYYYYS